MISLVLWQHVVVLCVSRTLFRMSLVMVVRPMLCSLGLASVKLHSIRYLMFMGPCTIFIVE